LQPESASAQYNLGTTLLQLGDHEAAISHLEHALKLDPEYARAHTNLGAALRLRGKPAEAIPHFRQALLARPDDGDTLYNLASALTVEGEFEEAITYYRRAVEVQPDAPDAHAELAWLLATRPDARTDDASEAVRLAERASRLTGRHNGAVLDVLAAAYAAAGRFDEAVATARAALALLPSQSELATSIRHRLDVYTNGRPYRRPR
jgi:protein O-mannosyl-transferase